MVGCQLGWLACGQAVSLAVWLDGQDGRRGVFGWLAWVVSLAVSPWMSLDGQDGCEAVCLDGWLVVRPSAWLSAWLSGWLFGWMVRMVVRLGWLACGQAVSAWLSAWLSGWMVRMVVRMVVRLSAWLVDLWSGCELGRLAGGVAV